MSVNVAIVGATGAVGEEFLRVMAERDFPADRLRLLASRRSAGRMVWYRDNEIPVEELTDDSLVGTNIALFSAGGSISRTFAPTAVKAGAVVVDNSSAFRMSEGVPLVVPESNPQEIARHNGIIANPNCSTIIMCVALWPLHKVNPIRRIVVSTYQAVSGAGAGGLMELEKQQKQAANEQAITREKFPHQIVNNLFSHDTPIGREGYNEEEMKLVKETRKIFGVADLPITATCVRVPVPRAHCESINIEFERAMSPDEVRTILGDAPGLRIVDNVDRNEFPMPLTASHQDLVLVGRIRQDISRSDGRGIDLFIAGDQIRKGAATNAIQIAERLL